MNKTKHGSIAQEAQAVREKNAEAIRLLDQWLSEESDYDQKVWPTIKQSIDQHRLSSRLRFENEEHHS